MSLRNMAHAPWLILSGKKTRFVVDGLGGWTSLRDRGGHRPGCGACVALVRSQADRVGRVPTDLARQSRSLPSFKLQVPRLQRLQFASSSALPNSPDEWLKRKELLNVQACTGSCPLLLDVEPSSRPSQPHPRDTDRSPRLKGSLKLMSLAFRHASSRPP